MNTVGYISMFVCTCMRVCNLCNLCIILAHVRMHGYYYGIHLCMYSCMQTCVHVLICTRRPMHACVNVYILCICADNAMLFYVTKTLDMNTVGYLKKCVLGQLQNNSSRSFPTQLLTESTWLTPSPPEFLGNPDASIRDGCRWLLTVYRIYRPTAAA